MPSVALFYIEGGEFLCPNWFKPQFFSIFASVTVRFKPTILLSFGIERLLPAGAAFCCSG